MRTLCDVNFLLAICYQRHIHHPVALAWLDVQDEQSMIICRNTQLALLRLLSNPVVMGENVCSLTQAWSIYDALQADERFDFASEHEGLEVFLREFTAGGTISPKFWQDAYLAAFARAAKMRLVTFDQGFKQFQGLKLMLLA